jgi:hypothetical protein
LLYPHPTRIAPMLLLMPIALAPKASMDLAFP